MNRLRQLKKSDWIAIALTGVLILIIAMPLSPKQSDSESTAEQETAAAVLDSGLFASAKPRNDGGRR